MKKPEPEESLHKLYDKYGYDCLRGFLDKWSDEEDKKACSASLVIVDTYNEDKAWCGICSAEMELVRPGKHQPLCNCYDEPLCNCMTTKKQYFKNKEKP